MSCSYTRNTARSTAIGNDCFAVQVGATTTPPLKAGRWMVTVTNRNMVKDVQYTIGAMLFSGADTAPTNPDIFGKISMRTLGKDELDGDGDDWEVRLM